MNRISLLAAAVLASAAPSAARAQGCLGVPLAGGQRAVLVDAGTSRYDIGDVAGGDVSGNDFGVTLAANTAGRLSGSLGYEYRTVGEADARMDQGSAALNLRAPLSLPVGVCLRAGAEVGRLSGTGSGTRYTNVTVPVGVVVELPFAVGRGATLAPYAAPLFLYSSTSGESFGGPVGGHGTGFGVEAGAGLRVQRLLLGGGIRTSNLEPVLMTPTFPRRMLFGRVGFAF